MTIITEYPIWFTFFCLLLGAGYAGILYYRNTTLDEMPKALVAGLAGIRFLLVSVLSFLLLGPMVKALLVELEKPIVVIAQDNSESIGQGSDSVFYRKAYGEQLNALTLSLAENYDVKTYSFGEKVREGIALDFTDKQTDVSELINELEVLYSNRNVGAVILASDGMYNKGMNPLYARGLSQVDAPFYTLALGDTNIRKDLILARVAHNRLAYLGNDFPIEATLKASQCDGEETTLQVIRGGEVVHTQTLVVKGNSHLSAVPIILQADGVGIQHYSIQLTPVPEEVSTLNNTMDIFIDVLDTRQKVLIVADAPHPDVSALRHAITANQNYELEVVLAEDKSHMVFNNNEAIKKYSLIILHQLPAKSRHANPLVKAIMASETPVLCIIGRNSDINALNTLSLGFTIQKSGDRFNEVQAVINEDSKLFSLEEGMERNLMNFPPLQAPFGEYAMEPGINVLLYQKIGRVETDQPLLLFDARKKVKRGIITGEGIWRWRLREYQLTAMHSGFDQLVSKIVQYLSLQEDKSPFRVFCGNHFLENEKVLFDAEVYNNSYELINDPEVNINIINAEGKQFPFVFRRAGLAYQLDAGRLEVGAYSYQATVRVGEKIHTEKGVFKISPIQVENIRTVANHTVLNNLALKMGGAMVRVEDMALLPELINAREDVKPIAYTTTILHELVHLKWIFFLLLGLVATEWFLRKKNGIY